MGGLDLFLAALLGLGLWRGFTSGALMQLVGTLGWIAAFVVGTALMPVMGDALEASLGVSARVAPLAGFVVAFGLVVAALTVAAHAARKTLKAVRLGGVDTVAGGGLGLLRAALGLSIFLNATGVSLFAGGEPLLISSETRRASLLHDPVEATAPVVWDAARAALPGLQDTLGETFNGWRSDPADAPA